MELQDNQLVEICLNTFAKYHNILVAQINVNSYCNKSINLSPPAKDGQVSAGILSKCIWIDINTPIGSFGVYMRKSGKGNVYWKQS